jgi:hypothetical protein
LLKNSFEEHPHHLTRRPFSEFLPPGHQPDTVDYQLFKLINAEAGRWALLDDLMRFSAVDLLYVKHP